MLLNEKQVRLLEETVEKFGHERQIDKAIEEMGELAQALLKDRYAEDDAFTDNVYEELADVFITFTELTLIYPQQKLVDKINEKLERLEKIVHPTSEMPVTAEAVDAFSEILIKVFERGMEHDIASTETKKKEIAKVLREYSAEI